MNQTLCGRDFMSSSRVFVHYCNALACVYNGGDVGDNGENENGNKKKKKKHKQYTEEHGIVKIYVRYYRFGKKEKVFFITLRRRR